MSVKRWYFMFIPYINLGVLLLFGTLMSFASEWGLSRKGLFACFIIYMFVRVGINLYLNRDSLKLVDDMIQTQKKINKEKKK